jgi:hypothetical protein
MSAGGCQQEDVSRRMSAGGCQQEDVSRRMSTKFICGQSWCSVGSVVNSDCLRLRPVLARFCAIVGSVGSQFPAALLYILLYTLLLLWYII